MSYVGNQPNELVAPPSAVQTAAAPSAVPSVVTFNLVSNTQLEVTVRGLDGTVRKAVLTLAP